MSLLVFVSVFFIELQIISPKAQKGVWDKTQCDSSPFYYHLWRDCMKHVARGKHLTLKYIHCHRRHRL